MPIEAGQMIDRYHIIEQLGQGGMATVYKAFDTRLERDVAIKIIRREVFSTEMLERVLKRFEREAKALAKLTHPNIVPILDYGEHEGAPYLVMAYLPGGTLKDRPAKPIPWQEAVKLVLPLGRALQEAHRANILHRDVKPANVLITSGGEPVLCDFGIAKILDLEEGSTLTGAGVGIGTPEYMSPEQGMGREVDGRTDQYALGVVLFELITGKKPYTADTPMAVLFKHVSDPLPRPGQFIPGLPEAVEQVLFKALAKQPGERYADMGALVTALEKLAGNAQPASVNEPAVATLLETPVPVVEAAPTVETFEDVIEAEPVEEEPLTSETFEPAEPSAEEGATSETFEPVIPAAAPTMETFEPGMQAAPPAPPPYEEKKGRSKLGLWLPLGFAGLLILAIIIVALSGGLYQPASYQSANGTAVPIYQVDLTIEATQSGVSAGIFQYSPYQIFRISYLMGCWGAMPGQEYCFDGSNTDSDGFWVSGQSIVDLVCSINDPNNVSFYDVTMGVPFTLPSTGELQCQINDSDLTDNHGAVTFLIEVWP